MNTVKRRLENRTNAVIKALSSLGDLNEKGKDYSEEDVRAIEKAIGEAVEESVNRLRTKPDMIGFTLDTSEG